MLDVLPQKDSLLTETNTKHLPYLRAVIKEALRLYPPAIANGRRVTQDFVMQGYQVPNGVIKYSNESSTFRQ